MFAQAQDRRTLDGRAVARLKPPEGVTGRGRDSGCPLPPAQTRARAANAHGSHLGDKLAQPTSAARAPSALYCTGVLWLGVQHRPMPRNLLGRPPSLHLLRRQSPALVRRSRRYYAVARLPAAVPEGLMAHRLLPPARRLLAGDNGVSRFSRMEFLCMPGVFDSAGPQRTCVGARRVVAFRKARRRWLPATPDFGAQYPAYRYPCPTLRVRPCDRPRMARGQGGSLRLPCTTLPFATPCRFIPAHPGRKARTRVISPRLPPSRRPPAEIFLNKEEAELPAILKD